jgi:hypothetical protein
LSERFNFDDSTNERVRKIDDLKYIIQSTACLFKIYYIIDHLSKKNREFKKNKCLFIIFKDPLVQPNNNEKEKEEKKF